MVSDAIWKELCEVSLSLGHIDEARRCATQVRNDAIRMVLESRLARRTAGRRGNFDEHGHFRPAGAPAASDAGPSNAELPPQSNRILDEAEEETGFGGHLVDAAHFLMHQHMPWLCLLTMLAFPVVIGLGGFLTAGTSTIALAAISALPGLCVCAIIFAMGRRILLESSHGVADVPEFPEIRALVHEAGRFVRDVAIVGLAMVIPIAASLFFDMSWYGLVPLVIVLAAMAPMAFCLRQLRGDSASMSPLLVAHAVFVSGPGYLATAAVCWLMLLPLVGVASYVINQPIWLQIAAVGPTAVLPVFVAMRLLGTWIDANYDRIGHLFGLTKRAAEAAAHSANTVTMGKRPAAATRAPVRQRPAASADARQPQPARRAPAQPTQARPAARTGAKGQPTGARPRPAAATGGPSPARRAPAGQRVSGAPRAPRAQNAPKPQNAPPSPAPAGRPDAPAPQCRITESHSRAVQTIEGRKPQAQTPPSVTDVPDLGNIPGAITVSGKDRVRSGAAARR